MKQCIEIDDCITNAFRKYFPDKDIKKLIERACLVYIVQNTNYNEITKEISKNG